MKTDIALENLKETILLVLNSNNIDIEDIEKDLSCDYGQDWDEEFYSATKKLFKSVKSLKQAALENNKTAQIYLLMYVRLRAMELYNLFEYIFEDIDHISSDELISWPELTEEYSLPSNILFGEEVSSF